MSIAQTQTETSENAERPKANACAQSPQPMAAVLEHCAGAEEVQPALQEFIENAAAEDAKWLCEECLDSSRAIGALLLSLPENARVLVVEATLGPMSRGVAEWASQVTSLSIEIGDQLSAMSLRKDWNESILKPERARRIQYAVAQKLSQMPFKDQEFDAVVVEGAMLKCLDTAKDGVCQILKELRRVAKSDGQIVLTVKNRNDYRRWLGGDDLDELSMTRSELSELLIVSGWTRPAMFAPTPSPNQITQLSSLGHASAPKAPRRSKNRIKSWLHRAAHQPSLYRHVAPYFMAVSDAQNNTLTAEQAGNYHETKRVSAIEQIWRQLPLDGEPLRRPLTISQMGVAIAWGTDTTGRDVIVRIPLSDAGQECVDRNASAQLQLSKSDLSKSRFWKLVPELIRETEYRNRRITVESRLPGRSLLRGESDLAKTAWRDVVEFIEALASVQSESEEGTSRERLDRRLKPLNRWLASDAARHSLFIQVEQMTKWMARQLVEWTPAHGDCHPGNVLVGRSGRVSGVIDWDRGLALEPVGLDLLKFAIRTSGDGGRKVNQAPWTILDNMENDLIEHLAARGCARAHLSALKAYYMLRLAAEQVDHLLVSQRQSNWALTLVNKAHTYLEENQCL